MSTPPARRLLHHAILLTFAALFMSFFLTIGNTAQDVRLSQGIADATPDPVAEATGQALIEQWEADFNSRTVFDMHIAYLIAPDVEQPESLVSPQTIQQYFGAEIVHSWDEFINLNAQEPFHVLMIHKSKSDEVDPGWTQQAYRTSSALMVGISVSFEQLAELVGERCMRNANPELFEQYENTFVIFSYAITLEDESYRAYVDEQLLARCNNRLDVGSSFAGIYRGDAYNEITQVEALEFLAEILIIHSMEYRMQLPRSGYIPLPTAAPASLQPTSDGSMFRR